MAALLSLETQFTVFMFVSTLAALAVGFRVFLPAVRWRSVLVGLVRTDWKYLGVAWVLTAGVNEAAHRFHAEEVYTDVVHGFEGSIVTVFQSFTPTWLTALFSFVYLIGLPFITLFTYFAVKATDPAEARRYALAYGTLTVSALPFFLAFPVGITAYTIPGVQPLMYELSPVIDAGIAATDTLVKAFPSLHAGLSVLGALYARKASRRYARFAAVLAGSVVLSTLYLGIHWLSDVVFVLVLVACAYLLSRRVDPIALNPLASRSPARDARPESNAGHGRR